MRRINKGTVKHSKVLWMWHHCNLGNTIYCAYAKPCKKNIEAFDEIKRRACSTNGYNHDLKITGAGSYSYSTMYSYTENGVTNVVYDTKDNTWVFEI